MKLVSKLPMNLQMFAEGEAETTPDNVEATPEGVQTVETEPTVEVDADPRKVMKYSDEDVDKLINSKMAKWKKDLEESEQKEKSRAKMTEAERAKADLDEREATLTRKALQLDYREKVATDGLSQSVLDVIDYSSEAKAEESYQIVKTMWEEFELKMAEGIKLGVEERLKGNTVSIGSTGSVVQEENEGARIAKKNVKAPAKSSYWSK